MGLQVGDKVYQVYHGNKITGVYHIDRVTKKQAVSENTKFRREYNNRVVPIGEPSWGPYSYFIETPELKEKLLRQSAINKIKGFNYDLLTTAKIQQILELIK